MNLYELHSNPESLYKYTESEPYADFFEWITKIPGLTTETDEEAFKKFIPLLNRYPKLIPVIEKRMLKPQTYSDSGLINYYSRVWLNAYWPEGAQALRDWDPEFWAEYEYEWDPENGMAGAKYNSKHTPIGDWKSV